jgi:hypothetical protein
VNPQGFRSTHTQSSRNASGMWTASSPFISKAGALIFMYFQMRVKYCALHVEKHVYRGLLIQRLIEGGSSINVKILAASSRMLF